MDLYFKTKIIVIFQKESSCKFVQKPSFYKRLLLFRVFSIVHSILFCTICFKTAYLHLSRGTLILGTVVLLNTGITIPPNGGETYAIQ